MNKLSKQQKIDVIQWLIIILLFFSCIYVSYKNTQINNEIEMKYDNAYVKIYDSQTLVALKTENKILYDSIKKLKNVESAIEIKYVNRYISDTIFVEKDTITIENDSVYHYENNTDSIQYKLDIKAKDIQWHKLDLTINDKLTLITKEEDGKVETSINTNYGKIEETTMWHRKNKTWKDRIKVGPTMGVGYGTLNKNFDLYFGVGVTIDIW